MLNDVGRNTKFKRAITRLVQARRGAHVTRYNCFRTKKKHKPKVSSHQPFQRIVVFKLDPRHFQ
jgi:hypothetical protein